jgi:predicted DNA-binding transcriptional regulator AlpA
MKPFYTVVDVARETGINRGTVARWLDDGKFPAERKSVGSVTAWTMTPEVFEAVCQHAKERKVAPRVAMTVNPNRKKQIEAEATPHKWGSMAEMIANCKTARELPAGVADGAEVWA